MSYLTVKHVAISGMGVCIPSKIEENMTLPIWDDETAGAFMKSTGIERRRLTDVSVCTSDLCIRAAESLLEELGWERGSVDCLVFVSQTPDYRLPATSCIIQDRMELSNECYTLDISLGCSGWVYALSVITSLMSSGQMKRGLLLAGDTISKICSGSDKSSYPLFGDAGTATAFEYDEKASDIKFQMNTDGGEYQSIIQKTGGTRYPLLHENDVDRFLKLDGMNVFTFGISKAPESVNTLLDRFSLHKESIDYYWFHQANLFMNEKIRKKLKLPAEKVPYSLKDFGNTSCATIPLTMITQKKIELETGNLKHLACGFGVGLSWGSVYFETHSLVCTELIEYK